MKLRQPSLGTKLVTLSSAKPWREITSFRSWWVEHEHTFVRPSWVVLPQFRFSQERYPFRGKHPWEGMISRLFREHVCGNVRLPICFHDDEFEVCVRRWALRVFLYPCWRRVGDDGIMSWGLWVFCDCWNSNHDWPQIALALKSPPSEVLKPRPPRQHSKRVEERNEDKSSLTAF